MQPNIRACGSLADVFHTEVEECDASVTTIFEQDVDLCLEWASATFSSQQKKLNGESL